MKTEDLKSDVESDFACWQANLAFSAIKDRRAIGKVMITFDDHKKTARSKL